MELITGIICLIALIVFFVMASNLGTIATQSKKQTELLEEIHIQLLSSRSWHDLVQLAEIEKFKGNVAGAIEKYKEAQYWLEKKSKETKDKSVLETYNNRLDGLSRIIKNLENPHQKA